LIHSFHSREHQKVPIPSRKFLFQDFLSRKPPFLFTYLHSRFTDHPTTYTARVSYIPSSFLPLSSIPPIEISFSTFSTNYNHILRIIISLHRLNIDLHRSIGQFKVSTPS
ncbi:hypothetical protein V8G54_020448, partial [Vigna mungo]